MDPNGSLSWSRHKLHSSMTQMPDAYVQTAIGIHRNILGWMNDRPVPEKKRAPLAYAIVFRAKSEPYLLNCRSERGLHHGGFRALFRTVCGLIGATSVVPRAGLLSRKLRNIMIRGWSDQIGSERV